MHIVVHGSTLLRIVAYEDEYPAIEDSELAERIFNDVGNIDYIYTVIQECVDESTEEQYMLMQQELV